MGIYLVKKKTETKRRDKRITTISNQDINSKNWSTFASSLNLYDPIYEGQRDNELTRRCGSLLKKVNFDEVLVL